MVRELFPRRAEILRDVISAADERRDGLLPMEVDGVTETFGDELTLLGALQLRWHTRLAARIDDEQEHHPQSQENAVVLGWLGAAEDMPGIRVILDHHLAHPASIRMADAIAKATFKEHEMLALMAGRASAPGEMAASLGRTIELAARASYVPRAPGSPTPTSSRPGSSTPTLMQRLRAAWAA